MQANGETLFCNCVGTPPWPGMVRLKVGGQDRYDVCRECGAVRQELCKSNGSLAETRWYETDRWDALPPLVAEQARAVLEQVEPEMILIPAGEFLLGSTDADLDAGLADRNDCKREWYVGEQPQHVVYLPDYSIARTPVTNAQYKLFIKASGYPPPVHWLDDRIPFGHEDHPVVGVSWLDGLAYCQWLTETSGKPYSLPSEPQWEKAASWETSPLRPSPTGRGDGGDGKKRRYPWGDEFDATRCNCSETGAAYTSPVETYTLGASPYGVLDMSGNVWEWTRSIHKEYPYNAQDGREDLQAEGRRVLRGGAFYYNRYDVRCAFRSSYRPEGKHMLIGFRPVILTNGSKLATTF